MSQAREAFSEFFKVAEPKLRHALASSDGSGVGSDAAAEALAWGWQNWDRVQGMDNPVGYLYRVGRTSANRMRQRLDGGLGGYEPSSSRLPEFEPVVETTLAAMSYRQRVAVVLVHGYGYRYGEVAELLECSASTVASHSERALAKLRTRLGVSDHV